MSVEENPYPPGFEAMFKIADADGFWFYTSYQGLWFTPDELREAHRQGRFRWGSENFKLRLPREYLGEHEAAFEKAVEARDFAKARVESWKQTRPQANQAEME